MDSSLTAGKIEDNQNEAPQKIWRNMGWEHIQEGNPMYQEAQALKKRWDNSETQLDTGARNWKQGERMSQTAYQGAMANYRGTQGKTEQVYTQAQNNVFDTTRQSSYQGNVAHTINF